MLGDLVSRDASLSFGIEGQVARKERGKLIMSLHGWVN